MNSRERFCETLAYGKPDRVPLFMEGIRDDVLHVWRQQGMPPGKTLNDLFAYDGRVEITPELEPRLDFAQWRASQRDLAKLEESLDPDDPSRLPESWLARVREQYAQGETIMLRVHRGLYQTLGVANWQGFEEINLLLVDDPSLVLAVLEIQANFAARLLQGILSEIKIDAAVFSEPISDNNGPLISPRMFAAFGSRSYAPLIDVLYRNGVRTLIFRSYANARILLPLVLEWGLNCLWACEENFGDMDYRLIRREFGRELRLIGGIDADVLRQDRQMIQREVMDKVPSLLTGGGFLPLADGRIRENVPYENYVFYRHLLEQVAGDSASSLGLPSQRLS